MLCVKSFGDVDILDTVGNVNYVGYIGHLRQQESVVFKASFIPWKDTCAVISLCAVVVVGLEYHARRVPLSASDAWIVVITV